MDPQPFSPTSPSQGPRPGDPLAYQSPGAHQRSQWITDEGGTGRLLVVVLIVLAAIGTLCGGVVAVAAFFLGWL